jgi:regulator of sigma E protease
VGMCLIAMSTADLVWWATVIPSVALGLGAVIFVHELGHFLVAKACGVKCEKFFIGFDVGGYKISRKWGETEYGIGILPLGGYVKMLGQDDNPANIAEQVRESQVAGAAVDAKEITGPDGKTYVIDRRSYLAKSVPQRMAIISAGVVMNIIFAFIFAAIAYKLGVPYNPSVVSQTSPGSPAWQADVRPGDEVVKIGDVVEPSFTDLSMGVSLSNLDDGVPFEIRRGDELLTLRLFPKQNGGLPRVGIGGPASLRLAAEQPAVEGTPAAAAEPGFEGGDEVVAVDGQPVSSYAEFASILVQRPADPLTVTVRRGGKPPADDPFGPLEGGEMVDVVLPSRPMLTLGLVMQMGKVVGVQTGSPADGKIQSGDKIESIADAASSPGGADAEDPLTIDPVTLPETLRLLADDNRVLEVSLRRRAGGGEGRETLERISITPREVEWLERAIDRSDPVVATALGIAYDVLSVVDRVDPGSPADNAGLQAGDVVTLAEFLFPADLEEKPELDSLDFTSDAQDKQASWPALVALLQQLPPGTKVKLTYERGDRPREATLAPVAAEGFFVPERGLAFASIRRIRIAKTWGEAVGRGWNETVSSLTMVYRFLGKVGSGQVSATTFGGPITIAQAAGFSAAEGPGKLLVFLTMLSANLAVINFLPIPLLDGGHMVFLLWEGIRGKPAGEKFVVAMHTAGFVFIITLMLFVLSLDFGLIPRKL